MPGRNLLSIEDRGELRRLAADLRRLEDGREVSRRLREELARVEQPTVRAVRASIRAIPSKDQSAARGRRSLRSKMAAATEGKVRTTRRPGLIVWVNPKRMPPGEGNLPGYMDGARPFHRWRHPTFGSWSGKRAVTQRAHPYFDRAVRSVPERVDRAGARVIDRVARDIETGG
jgi:hypothetical protein